MVLQLGVQPICYLYMSVKNSFSAVDKVALYNWHVRALIGAVLCTTFQYNYCYILKVNSSECVGNSGYVAE